MLQANYPVDDINPSSRQTITHLRKLLTDPKCDPEIGTTEWIHHAESAEIRSNRMELRLLLNLLDRVSFPLPVRLQAYQVYYQGILYELEADYSKAEECFRQGYNLIAGQANYELLEALLKRGLANALMRRNETEEAVKFLLEALAILQPAKMRLAEGNALKSLAHCYYKLGEIDKSLEAAQEAIDLAREINNINIEAAGYNTLGLCFVATNRMAEGKLALERTVDLRKATGNTRDLGASYLNLGLVYDVLGDLRNAIENTQMALTLSLQVSNNSIAALAYINLAGQYNKQNEGAKALEAGTRAQQLFQELQDQTMVAAAQTALSVSCSILGKEEQARKYLAEVEIGLEQIKQKNNNTVMAQFYANLAEAVLRLAISPEDHQKAYNYRNEALKLLEGLHDVYNICGMLEQEANILLNTQRRYKHRKTAFQTLQKWWEFMQKLPESEPAKHIPTLLTFAELLSEQDHKAQSFEIYSLAFNLIQKNKNAPSKRTLAEHYLKASKTTTPDKALPLAEQALEWLRLENIDPLRLRDLNNEVSLLRKQQKSGKWFSGKN